MYNDTSVGDGWDQAQVGFRTDWRNAQRSLTLQGDAYDNKSEVRALGGTVEASGGNILARWTRSLADGSNLRVQGYYDHTERTDNFLLQERADLFDVELHHGIPLDGHYVQWGAGHRHARDDSDPGLLFAFIPGSRKLDWANVYGQDEIRLRRNLSLTLGVRVERNDYIGVEALPNARLGWKLSPERLVWLSLSRAVRAPARLDREIFTPSRPPFFIVGGPDFQSEVVKAVEAGYRAQPLSSLSYSLTAYHQIYDKLRSGQLLPNGQLVIDNRIEGTVSGIEAWGHWQATSNWRLSAGVNAMHKDFHLRPESNDPVGPGNLGNDPEYQWQLRSSLDLTEQHEFNVQVRRVGALPTPAVPAYTAVDARYGWRVDKRLELSVTAQNLFDPSHPEFGTLASRSEFQRGVFVKLLWRQ